VTSIQAGAAKAMLGPYPARQSKYDWTLGRQRPAFADIPVVVHSSAPSRAPLGVTRVLQKPVAFERLLSVVREYCA
jgi:hypothetical protein